MKMTREGRPPEWRELLTGQLDIHSIQRPQARVVRVYLCSAATDSVRERTSLIKNVYPKLREYCTEKYGLEFQMVDLKWGVDHGQPDNADKDLFLNELTECQRISTGPNFLALIGQRYGERCLPARLPANHMEVILHALRQRRNRDTRDAALLEQWYRLDENACQPEYCLLPEDEVIPVPPSDIMKMLRGEREEKLPWQEARTALQRLLTKGLEYCLNDGVVDEAEARSYFISDLEKEVQVGLLETVNPTSSCCAIIRKIIDLKNYTGEESASDFMERKFDDASQKWKTDNASETLLSSLIDEKIPAILPEENIHKFHVLWKHDHGIHPTLHQEYLDELSQTCYNSLQKLIDKNALAHENDMTASALQNEISQQWLLAKDRTDTFIGRENIMNIIKSYVLSNDEKPLVLYGDPGSGKTATIAKAAIEISNWLGEDSICVVRFIGTTQMSFDIRQLLHSICLQLTLALGRLVDEVPTIYKDLLIYFNNLLETIPGHKGLVILLDSLNMLLPEYGAHLLEWLPRSLRENVKIIVSTQPDMHNILSRLQTDVSINDNNFLEMHEMEVEECVDLLMTLLVKKGRTLTEDQQHWIREVFKECQQPFTAYLVLPHAIKWKSWQQVDPQLLPKSWQEYIYYTLDQLEAKHGKNLVSKALATITASTTGISDCEMEDILSLDDEVLTEVFRGTVPSVLRLPSYNWLKLKHDLKDFLITKDCDGTSVFFWYHRQFVEATKKRYLNTESDRRTIHALLADYFNGVWYSKSKPFNGINLSNKNNCFQDCDRLVPQQPMEFGFKYNNKRYNIRKLEQVPRHLYLAGKLKELDQYILFNYDWIYNKTKAMSLERVLADFMLNPSLQATLVERALRDAQHFIENMVENMGPEITGRLLIYYNTHSNIRDLLQQCDTKGVKNCGLLPVFPYYNIPGSPLRYSLQTKGNPTSFALCGENSQYILCKESPTTKVSVYDLTNGKAKYDIITSIGEMQLTPSGHRIVVVDHIDEKSIKIHCSQTGRFQGQLIPINQVQMKTKQKYKLEKVTVSDSHVCIIITTDKSYLCIADVNTCKFLHVQGLDGRANICHITEDARYIFTNCNDNLLCFDLLTLEQTSATSLGKKPMRMVTNKDSTKAFIINEEEHKIYVLIIKHGVVEFMYKIVVSEAFEDDKLHHLTLSNSQDMLLVHGNENLMVYNINTEKVVCHIDRPTDIPSEFKLPRSGYIDIGFTQASFSPDDKFIIASIFRNIYIWQVANSSLLTTLKAPVGIIDKLFVPNERGEIVTHLQESGEVHVWGLGDALAQIDMLDRLTAPVVEIKVSNDDKTAFIRCTGSDELGVLDIHRGKMVDLLTHEKSVQSFTITAEGGYAFVTTEQSKPGQRNKIWHIETRKIIYEFGDGPSYSVAQQNESSIIALYKDGDTNASFRISSFKLAGTSFDEYRFEETVRHILEPPFVTPDDRYMVVLTADDYIHQNAFYVNPTVCAFSLRTGSNANRFSASDLQNQVKIRRILQIRPCASNSYTVLVFYTNELDIIDIRERTDNPYHHCYGFMLLDVCSGVVVQLIEDFASPQTPLNDFIFTKDVSLGVDDKSNIFDMGTGYYVKQLQENGVCPRCLALNGKIVLYYERSCLYGLRMADGTRIGHIDAHADISSLTVCGDERTILVGCKDGSVFCFVVVDPEIEKSEDILAGIPSRNGKLEQTNNNVMMRSWDKVNFDKWPQYSRPPSAITNGPTDRDLLKQIRPMSRAVSRTKSNTSLYLNTSKACIIM